MYCWKDLIELYKVTSNERHKNWTLRASKKFKKEDERKKNQRRKKYTERSDALDQEQTSVRTL